MINQMGFEFGASGRMNLTTDAGFAEWINSSYGQNVGKEFIHRATVLKDRGFKHFGAKAIVEAMRYDYALKFGVKAADSFKINNNVVSRLSRWAMKECPALSGMFSIRGLKKEEAA